MLSQLVFNMPRLRQLRLVTFTSPGEEINPGYKRAVMAMLNARSSPLSVTLSLCDTWDTEWGWGWGGNLQRQYEAHAEHSFTRSSPFGTNVEINVRTGMHELALSAYRWRTI